MRNHNPDHDGTTAAAHAALPVRPRAAAHMAPATHVVASPFIGPVHILAP